MESRHHITASEFNQQIAAIIEKHNIDRETGILHDLIYIHLREKGIDIHTEDKMTARNDLQFDERSQQVTFHLPQKNTVDTLVRVLAFFNIPQESHTGFFAISIDADLFMREILPKMKTVMAEMVHSTPHLLHRYQIDSRIMQCEIARLNVVKCMEPILKDVSKVVSQPNTDLDEAFNIVTQLNQTLNIANYQANDSLSPDQPLQQHSKANHIYMRLQRFVAERPVFGIAYPGILSQLKNILAAYEMYNKFEQGFSATKPEPVTPNNTPNTSHSSISGEDDKMPLKASLLKGVSVFTREDIAAVRSEHTASVRLSNK